jgi:DNA-binding response OmpR family regulator/HPt (histidine-containing phosphotransfer) domain-containing protein
MDEELDLDDPETVMREARSRFIEAFPGRVRSITMLFNAMSSQEAGGDASQATARRMTHQMAGIAGTLGFPGVSEKASDLEQLVISSASGQAGVRSDDIERALGDLSASFARDMEKPAPAWAKPPERAAGPRVLVVEDDEMQRKVVSAWLRGAGYQVSGTGDGSEAFTKARIERPALIILDVDLPGADGHAICRKLKSSPDLASTPVVFMTTRASLNDRLTGVALGADDYLIKPIDQSELLLRIGLLVNARAAAPAEPEAGLLTYEAFAFAAQDLLRRESVLLAMIRLPRGQESQTAMRIVAAAGRTDLVAMLDANHALWLIPGADEAGARLRVNNVAAASSGLGAGIAIAAAGTRSLEALLGDADQQLNGARVAGSAPAEMARPLLVLMADDDPAIMRIVDAQLKAAGYRTQLVFDGVAAASAITEKEPDIVLLDLMMPKRTGFDVLAELSQRPKRPRVIVLSARGREEDVTRAFSLGADDYVTKPFSPQELMARIARLRR